MGRRAAPLLAVLVVTAVFLPLLGFGFTSNDDPVYVDNPMVAAGLSPRTAAWALTTTEGDYWHPVMWLSLFSDRAMGGTAGVMHTTNLVLHGLCVALLCLLLMRAGASPWLACGLAILFGVHPLRLEAVAEITGRKDLLLTLFTLLAALAYLDEKRKRAFGFFLLACASKPTGFMIPALLFCLDVFPLKRKLSWALVIEKRPFWLCALAVAVLARVTEGANVAELGGRLSLSIPLMTYFDLIRKTVLPPIDAFPWAAYGFDPDFPMPAWALALSATLLAGLTYFAWSRRKRAPWLLAGWAWFVLAILPVSGFTRFSKCVACDRYTYLATIGPCLALAASLPRKKPLLEISALAFVALTALTERNLQSYRDDLAFKKMFVDTYPGSALARKAYGLKLMREKDFTAALAQFSTGAALRPERLDLANDRAVALAMLGRRDEARTELSRLDDPRAKDNAKALAEGRAAFALW